MDMRIDELAQRAGVPTRTIRYYTQQGLLPSPRLRGRVGYYDEGHLDRLRLIKELQEKRFLPLSVIRSVVRHFEAGADLETMLAPLDWVFQPRWDAALEHRDFTRSELAKTAGVDASVVDAAEEMGFLFPVGRGRDRRYTADDVQMLGVAKRWLDLGIPRDLGKLYRESLDAISKMQVKAFNESVAAPLAAEEHTPEETQRLLLEGYREMSSVFQQLVALLHRKALQNAVEFFADHEDAPSEPPRDASAL
ncbi:MAG TPA: MerR family transcriptional regulator [Actinomycetota bacterium]|jgi:DNA-binding transcriptional MerR regulator|nr:MerR family transcriptional regulator [Actinomycetota bacterium]